MGEVEWHYPLAFKREGQLFLNNGVKNMAVSFNKKKSTTPAKETTNSVAKGKGDEKLSLADKFAALNSDTESQTAQTPGKPKALPKGHSKTLPKFLKTGPNAQQAMDQEQKQIEEAKNQLWRFYMGVGDEKVITFLDGDLDANGVLSCPMWWEHQTFRNGNWRNWDVCTKETELCPICDLQGNFSSLVAGFTVIDHSSYKGKTGVVKDTLKLFVCKRTTLKILQKKAVQNKGLAGATFEVSRISDKSSNCGEVFDFLEKNTLQELQKEFQTKEKPIFPVDFADVIIYRTADELKSLYGLGSAVIGSEEVYEL